MSTRTVLSPSCLRTSRVPSSLPSSTTMISRSIPSGSSTARIRRRISTSVLRSLNTGTTTDSLRSFGGGVLSRETTGALLHIPVARERETFTQLDPRFPVEQRAGACDVGPAARRVAERQRLEHQIGARTGHREDEVGQLEHGEFDGVTDVDRLIDVGVE